jgi:hypothetical protein
VRLRAELRRPLWPPPEATRLHHLQLVTPPLEPSEPFLHVLTTPLEPAKPLAHLHGRRTHRRRGRGGRRSTPPPFSIAGAPPDTRNDKNRTPGEPTPLPRPFPAKSGLPLAGIRPSPLLFAPRTAGLHCRGQDLFRGLDARTRDLFVSTIYIQNAGTCKIH